MLPIVQLGPDKNEVNKFVVGVNEYLSETEEMEKEMISAAVAESLDVVTDQLGSIKLMLIISETLFFVCRFCETNLVSQIRQLSSNLTTDVMQIEVRRQFILEDAIRYSHKNKFDPRKKIKVRLMK